MRIAVGAWPGSCPGSVEIAADLPETAALAAFSAFAAGNMGHLAWRCLPPQTLPPTATEQGLVVPSQ
jgi:hypothetical protein